jgi:hypothetical protein
MTTLNFYDQDIYVRVLREGNTIVYNDLEMTDLSSNLIPRSRIQVYKKRLRVLENGKYVNREYNKIHYNYLEAVQDYLRIKDLN